MRFYYISIISIFLLTMIYAFGTAVLAGMWLGLRKRWKKIWMLVLPLLLLLYVAPIVEELWIAWNFGQLCKKDAGIFIYKTVEAEGFYDATRPTHAGPRNQQAAEDLDRGGYRYYEMVFPNYEGGPIKVVHLEKVNGVWTATVLDHPTARYHYSWPHMDTPMNHKVEKIERVVSDKETGELLARETKYRRRAPWFFLGLDRPVMLCPGPGEHPLEKFGSVYNQALKPVHTNR